MSKKSDNQTQFAQVEPILAEVVNRDDEAVILSKKKKTRQRRLIFGGLLMLGVLILLILELTPGPAPTLMDGVAPTPTVTPIPIDQSLLGRIQRGRANMEAIDLYQADLSYPPIDVAIMLDEPPKER